MKTKYKIINNYSKFIIVLLIIFFSNCNTSNTVKQITTLQTEEESKITNIKPSNNKEFQTFYVSPYGSDENDGISEETPYKTLQKALSMNMIYIKIIVIGNLTDETEKLNDNDFVFKIIVDKKNNIVPCEIIITGKENATEEEKAILSGCNTSSKVKSTLLLKISKAATVTLRNIQISNGKAYGKGGGIHIDNTGGAVTLGEGVVITKNYSTIGAGIFLEKGFLEIDGCEIKNNEASIEGGGIYVSSGGIVISSGSISNNIAYNGAGVYLEKGSLVITDGFIQKNNSRNAGGGIYNNQGVLVMTGGNIMNNKAIYAGGIHIAEKGVFEENAGNISLNNSLYFNDIYYSKKLDIKSSNSYYVKSSGNDDNDGLSEDKAFKTLSKAITLAIETDIKTITVIGLINIESEFTYENRYNKEIPALFMIYNSGEKEIIIRGKDNANERDRAILSGSSKNAKFIKPVIRIFGKSNIKFENIEISGGKSEINTGSGITLDKGSIVTIGDKTIICNNQGAGIFIKENSILIFDNGEISNNKGTGIVVCESTFFVMKNGNIMKNSHGIYSSGGSVVLMNGYIKENKSDSYGTGIDSRFGSLLILLGGNIINNKNERYGGGINIGYYGYPAQDICYISSCNISENESNRGGGISLFQDATLLLRNSAIISKNKATNTDGGGLYLHTNSIVSMNGGKIIENYANGWGGGVCSTYISAFFMHEGLISENKENVNNLSGGIFLYFGGEIINGPDHRYYPHLFFNLKDE